MRVERPSNHSRIVVLTTGLPEAELKPVSHPVRVELRCPAYPLRRTNAVIVLARPTCQYAEGRKGDEYRISNTRDFTLEIPKYSGADSLQRQIQFLPQRKAEYAALPTGSEWRLKKRGKGKSSVFFTELFGNRRQQLER